LVPQGGQRRLPAGLIGVRQVGLERVVKQLRANIGEEHKKVDNAGEFPSCRLVGVVRDSVSI
jgi:hypothetical protein